MPMSQRRSKVLIDGKSGKVIAEGKSMPRPRKRRKIDNRADKMIPVPPPLAETAIADVALALGLAEAVFETVDYIADVFERHR